MTQPMKILITGARGMLGTDLTAVFTKALGGKAVVSLGSAELDITNVAKVHSVIAEVKPTVVVNAAAYTNVDKAETESELALSLNALGPELLANACSQRGAQFIHFSTERSSMTVTSYPLLRHSSTKWLPMKPAPPVTITLCIFPLLFFSQPS